MNNQKPTLRIQKDNYNLKADFDYLSQNNYTVLKQIGRGSYGVVYKAQDKNMGGYCAIKINFNIILREQLYVEMALLALMRSKPRLPFLHKVIEKKGAYSIIMDYYKSKSFVTFFSEFDWVDIKHYLYQLLLGLKELKELGIYHRDIKPSNFLYDEGSKKGVIVDYGLAETDKNFVQALIQKLQSSQDDIDPQQYQQLQHQVQLYKNIETCLKTIGRNKIGTQIFMPPQSILRMENQSYSSDIWPVGIIFLQFCSKRFNIFSQMVQLQNYFKLEKNGFYVVYLLQLGCLFGKDRVRNVCKECFQYQLVFPDCLKEVSIDDLVIRNQYDEDAKDLMHKLLHLDPSKRITAQQALAHNFFNQVRQQHQQQIPQDQDE